MAAPDRREQEENGIKRFDPRILDRSVIAIPLLEAIDEDDNKVRAVIIDVNIDYDEGRDTARTWIREAINAITEVASADENQGVRKKKTELSNQYIFARLSGKVIREVVRLDAERAATQAKKKKAEKPRQPKKRGKASVQSDTAAPYRFRAIYRIWPDFKISPCITKSLATVKADAAQTSFCAHGMDITWAVMDSGIDANHPHFTLHKNVDPTSPLHADFTDTPNVTKGGNAALVDRFGHGTHVAGIVAGEQVADDTKGQAQKMRAITRSVRGYEEGNSPAVETHEVILGSIRGMAPRCRLVSLKVLDDEGNGEVSNLIAAIAHIQEKNGHGRLNLIHGVNISLGYDFDPEWFACGQSPLCVEINRLVRSGVVVVVAAGNTGYGALAAQQRTTNAGMPVTINDPGNAELAITVGSTHREMPHVYGVSYFSSKGPTGDGRMKPDIVAPGEKILSAATGKLLTDRAEGKQCEYVEDSGTSMAAPHVSGVIAAFLSVRREFIGEPERVKEIFLGAATDLKRERSFQGAGLIDLMRAIQSV
jgi:serine protease AprX